MGISDNHPVLSGVPKGTVLCFFCLFLIMISDIDKDVSASKLISFADDTRLYSGVRDVTDCDNLQFGLNNVYDWALSHMFLTKKKFSYSSNVYACKSNVYIDPAMNIINPSTHMLDLGFPCPAIMLKPYWILKIFTMRYPKIMFTVFKSLILSRLDYTSQLWSHYLLKHVYIIEKV